jgi:hypothetical protein
MQKPPTTYNLGRLYEQGSGVPRDSGLARLWYEKAAVLGDPEAMLSLGVLYENGRGVPTDYEQARQFYESTIDAKEEILQTEAVRLHVERAKPLFSRTLCSFRRATDGSIRRAGTQARCSGLRGGHE